MVVYALFDTAVGVEVVEISGDLDGGGFEPGAAGSGFAGELERKARKGHGGGGDRVAKGKREKAEKEEERYARKKRERRRGGK